MKDVYTLTEAQMDALLEKNSKATVDKAAQARAKEVQARIENAARLNRIGDKELARYYDYTATGKLKSKSRGKKVR